MQHMIPSSGRIQFWINNRNLLRGEPKRKPRSANRSRLIKHESRSQHTELRSELSQNLAIGNVCQICQQSVVCVLTQKPDGSITQCSLSSTNVQASNSAPVTQSSVGNRLAVRTCPPWTACPIVDLSKSGSRRSVCVVSCKINSITHPLGMAP